MLAALALLSCSGLWHCSGRTADPKHAGAPSGATPRTESDNRALAPVRDAGSSAPESGSDAERASAPDAAGDGGEAITAGGSVSAWEDAGEGGTGGSAGEGRTAIRNGRVVHIYRAGEVVRIRLNARVQIVSGFPPYAIARADGQMVQLVAPGRTQAPFVGSQVVSELVWDQTEFTASGERRRVAAGEYTLSVNLVPNRNQPNLTRAKDVASIVVE